MRHERVCERPPAGRRGSSVIDLTTGRRHSGESEPSETKTRSGYFRNISTSRPPKADRDVKVSRRAIRFQELVRTSRTPRTSRTSRSRGSRDLGYLVRLRAWRCLLSLRRYLVTSHSCGLSSCSFCFSLW